MSESSDQELLAAVETFIAGRSPDEVLTAIYNDQNPPGLEAVTALVPLEQIAIVALIERLNRPDISSLVILYAALRAIQSPDEWIHYNICKVLDRTISMGTEAARQPAIIHALLAIDGLGDFASAHTLPLGVLARELTRVAPREAIRRGMLSAKRGGVDGLTSARGAMAQLGLPAGPATHPITLAMELAKALHLGADNIQQTTSLEKAAGRRSRESIAPGTIVAPPVHADASHYVLAQSGKQIRLPGITVHSIPSAIFSIDATSPGNEQHYLFDGNRDCILEFANGSAPFIEENAVDIGTTIAILDDLFTGSSLNICHFLLDRITRIHVYERVLRHPVKYLLVDDYPYQRQILTRMGLIDQIIIPSTKRFSVKAPEILISSNIANDFEHPAHFCSPWALNYLREKLHIKDRPARAGRKIMISRGDAPSRRILNWDMLEPILKRNDFDIVELAHLSADQQIDLFADAEQVVGVHGAGLTNILFAPRACAVLEIMPPLIGGRDYWLLSSGLGQHYATLIAEDPLLPRPDYTTWRHDPKYLANDIIVDPIRFENALVDLDNVARARR